MKINRKELRDKLSSLKPGLGKKEMNPQVTHFLFFNDIIATFNEQILITIPFETGLDDFSVKAEEFFRLIDGISDETIDLTLKDGKLKLRSKSTSATMATYKQKDDEVSKMIGIDDSIGSKISSVLSQMGNWHDVPEELIPGMVLCSFAASTDVSSGIRSCVCVQGDKIYATDNARISRYVLTTGSVEEQDFNIPARFVPELAKFPVIHYCMTKRWAHFRTEDGVTFSCSVLEGEMPATIEDIFSTMEDMSFITLPEGLSEILESVTMLASDVNDQRGRKTHVHLNGKEIFIKAENDLGWVEKSMPFEFDGEFVKFAINNNFFTQILKHATNVAWDKPHLYFSSGTFSHFMIMLREGE